MNYEPAEDQHEGRLSHICKYCGVRETGRYLSIHMDNLKDRRECNGCNFWSTKIYSKGFFHADGQSFYNAEAMPDKLYQKPIPFDYSHTKGHGGRTFRIRFKTSGLNGPEGTIITSNDIWHQGPIPVRWRSGFQEAEFIKQDETP